MSAKRPSSTLTKNLIADAKASVPRLRELTENELRNFLVNEETLGIICKKYRTNIGNGWTFPPLAEAREAWTRRYGPVTWDNAEAADWEAKTFPKLRLLDRKL